MKKFALTKAAVVSLSLLPLAACNKPSMKGSPKQGVVVAASTAGDQEKAESPAVSTTSADDPEAAHPVVVVEDETALFKECASSPKRNIVGDLIKIPTGTKLLPDFTTYKVISQICLEQLNITGRELKDGFPGATTLNEWYGINFNFNMTIPKAGEYTFSLNSDDGSALYIDGGSVVVNNDGLHTPVRKEKSITMTAGKHAFNVRYFQGQKFVGKDNAITNIALELKWKAPGEKTESYLPLESISRP